MLNIYGSFYDNYYVICMYYETFFSYRLATRYSNSNVYMSLFIMSLMINVYM